MIQISNYFCEERSVKYNQLGTYNFLSFMSQYFLRIKFVLLVMAVYPNSSHSHVHNTFNERNNDVGH